MICKEWINACNAKTKWCMWWNYDFLGYMDGYSSHSHWLNHGYKIECLQGHLKIVKSRWHPFIWIGMWTNRGNGWRCIARRRLKSLGKNFKRSFWSDLGRLRRRILMRLCLEYVKGGNLGTTSESLRDLLIGSIVGLKMHWWEHSWVFWRMILL